MRNRALHDALRCFALEAAQELGQALREGGEIPFEVDQEPGGGAVLYRYRPLTAEFIEDHWSELRSLPAFPGAADALGAGAAAYLRVQGEGGVNPEPALRAMLDRLYEDATSFEFPEERFERVYAEVERTLFDGLAKSTLVAPLHGLRLEQPMVPLADGLMLARGDAVDAPPEAVWRGAEGTGLANALCVLERDVSAGGEIPVGEARELFDGLLGGLRLWRAGALAFGAFGWMRVDEGRWREVSLGPGGTARGDEWLLEQGEDAALREFLELAASAPRRGTVSWALRRFQMGCERADDGDALTDYLLALGALLDARDESGRAGLPMRVAALCAEEHDRRSVQRRVEQAIALEGHLVRGAGADHVDEFGVESPRALAAEIEGYVRALLRDVLCGYLDPGLRAVADDILLRSGEPLEADAHAAAAGPSEPDAGERADLVTAEVPALDDAEDEWAPPEVEPAVTAMAGQPPEVEPEVTHTADLDEAALEAEAARAQDAAERPYEPEPEAHAFDDDPASYSAPV